MPDSQMPGFHGAYLGKRLQDLLDLAHEQMQVVYTEQGLDIPVQGSSTLQAISPGTSISSTQLATLLGQSHQLVAQRLAKLLKRGLIESTPDDTDGRRTLYSLTPEGERRWQALNATMDLASAMNASLFDEISVDLTAALEAAIAALHKKPMIERIGLIKASGEEQLQK